MRNAPRNRSARSARDASPPPSRSCRLRLHPRHRSSLPPPLLSSSPQRDLVPTHTISPSRRQGLRRATRGCMGGLPCRPDERPAASRRGCLAPLRRRGADRMASRHSWWEGAGRDRGRGRPWRCTRLIRQGAAGTGPAEGRPSGGTRSRFADVWSAPSGRNPVPWGALDPGNWKKGRRQGKLRGGNWGAGVRA